MSARKRRPNAKPSPGTKVKNKGKTSSDASRSTSTEKVILRDCGVAPSSNDARAALRFYLRETDGKFDKKARILRGHIDPKVVSHPYARGPDLANDELGYGEAVSIPVAVPAAGALVSGTVVEVRTKTGTIIVPDED